MRREELIKVLNSWGSTQPLVKTIYIFGSRARNDYRPDSDLDIAVVFDSEDEDGGLSEWMDVSNKWRSQLQQLLPFNIHLECYERESTPTIREGIEQSGILAYSKI